MCPDCAERRLETGRFFMKTFVLLIVALAVAALVFGLVENS